MAPLALALAEAGHEVAFATAEEFCTRVERVGLRAFPAGMGHAEQLERAQKRFPVEAAQPPGQERFITFVPKMLGGVAAPAMLADLVPIMRRWRPDVLVHDEAELAGPVAATVAGIPWVDHGIAILRPWRALHLQGEALRPAAAEWGVDVGPLGGMLRYLYLSVCPPSVQAAHVDEVDVAYPIQVDQFDVAGADDQELPAWVAELPDRPTVYVTLGTIFNRAVRMFRSILEALRDEPLNVIVTIGHNGDRDALGPQPDNVHIERYIPQSLLLPHCDVVVGQAGWSFVNVLRHGLPILALPMGAIQFYHAQACLDCGAGRRLLPPEVTVEAIRAEVRTLLRDPSYRENAARVGDELRTMPSPESAVPVIERLALHGTPLVKTVR